MICSVFRKKVPECAIIEGLEDISHSHKFWYTVKAYVYNYIYSIILFDGSFTVCLQYFFYWFLEVFTPF